MRPLRDNLRMLMQERGLTQAAFGERLGITQSAVGHYLNGRRKLNRTILDKMATVLGVTIVELANISSDLQLANTPEASEAAEIMDRLTDTQRSAAIHMLRSLDKK